jgi:acyl dehydratase
MGITKLFEATQQKLGQELGPTRWREVLQSDINAFGAATYDPDLMHIDPEWAAKNSPFGHTIAFGFWTFSMLTCFMHELEGRADGSTEGEFLGVNYGFDRLRFIEPVPVGSRIRGRSTLAAVTMPARDRILRTQDVTVEIENVARPALAARWLTMLVVPEQGAELTGFRRVAAV